MLDASRKAADSARRFNMYPPLVRDFLTELFRHEDVNIRALAGTKQLSESRHRQEQVKSLKRHIKRWDHIVAYREVTSGMGYTRLYCKSVCEPWYASAWDSEPPTLFPNTPAHVVFDGMHNRSEFPDDEQIRAWLLERPGFEHSMFFGTGITTSQQDFARMVQSALKKEVSQPSAQSAPGPSANTMTFSLRDATGRIIGTIEAPSSADMESFAYGLGLGLAEGMRSGAPPTVHKAEGSGESSGATRVQTESAGEIPITFLSPGAPKKEPPTDSRPNVFGCLVGLAG